MKLNLNLNPEPEPVCKHCKKKWGLHKAHTLHCPIGSKSKIGYTQYHQSQAFEARKKRK
jgi:hypothetical protein